MEWPRRTILLFLLVLALAPAAAFAQAGEPTLIRLSDAVGDTIDMAERDSFHLFPNTAGFQHAVILALPGPEFYAKVTLATAVTARQVFLRIMPGDLQRIRFLVNNREYVAGQQKSDSTAVQSIASFWQSIEEHPLQGMAGEPANAQQVPSATTEAATAGEPQSESVAVPPQPLPANTENRYNYALHGTTLGSIAGGCIGSHAGITFERVEQPGCFPAYSVFRVDPCVFWGASCGITALGTGAGYVLGNQLDREPPVEMTQLKEGTNWRNGLAIAGLVPGVAVGLYAFLILGGTHYGVTDWFDVIENDPNEWTTLPMAFTGLCIAVESATIGYRIGRSIDRRKAEEAEARRRALGR